MQATANLVHHPTQEEAYRDRQHRTEQGISGFLDSKRYFLVLLGIGGLYLKAVTIAGLVSRNECTLCNECLLPDPVVFEAFITTATATRTSISHTLLQYVIFVTLYVTGTNNGNRRMLGVSR